VATVVREMNFLRRTVGQVILGSAIVDDTIGWIIIAVIFGLALQGHVDPLSVAKSVIGTLTFMAFSLTIGRRWVSLAIRWVNDTFVSEYAVITAILVIMGLMALTTHLIGVHAVLGAFVAGILIGESPILTRHIDEQFRGLILAFFMPVFFGTAGLSADLVVVLKDPHLLLLTLGLIAIATIGKFAGAFLGGELGGLSRPRGAGAGHRHERTRFERGDRRHHRPVDGRAQPGPVHDNRHHGDRHHAGDAADLALGARPAADPRGGKGTARARRDGSQGLRVETRTPSRGGGRQRQRPVRHPRRRYDRRHPLDADNRHAHHGQQNSRREEKPTLRNRMTPKKRRKRQKKKHRSAPRPRRQLLKDAAEQMKRRRPKDQQNDRTLDVTVIANTTTETEVVAEEAEKGYDLLVVGLDKTTVRDNTGFHANITQLASGFDGPLVIADARDGLLNNPTDGKLSILVPVNGTEPSRRAAEVAFAMARAARAPVTVLYVAPPANGGRKRFAWHGGRHAQGHRRAG